MSKKRLLLLFLGLFVLSTSAAQQAATTNTNRKDKKQDKIEGCRLFPVNNIWNTPIESLPVDANSDLYINTIGASSYVHADFGSGLWEGEPIGIPYTTVPGTQEKVAVTFLYDDESDPGPYPIPPDAPIEGGSSSDGDRHVLVVDRDNCILYELYDAYPQPDGSWTAGSGAIFDLKSNALRPAGWTSADAAGLPILPGLVRYEEVAAGEINHAIRVTAPQTRRAYVWPARHYASSLTDSQYPPMGQRFRLKANFDISGFSPQVQVILTTLKKYGMILADNGMSWFISGVPDERWNNDILHELHNVKGSDFEAVDVSSLMISPNSGAAVSAATTQPVISLNRTQLNAGAVVSAAATGSQTFLISNSGTGTLNWTITPDAGWLSVNPTSGTNSLVVTVSINPSGLSTGTYTGTITISDTNAVNSPQTVTVNLMVMNVSQDQPPIGSFDTPIDGSTVRSSIPVTGWALDDVDVDSVKIYRQVGSQLVYIGDAVFVEGARPDVETAYPGYPNNYKAGWGYMMLTNFLPDNGNGTFQLHALAEDVTGNQVTLGTKTIICDNVNAVKPFGAIDTPTQGGTASGSDFINWGWVLTPMPNSIPTDGSTIDVYVDGVNIGHPIYNNYRADIAGLFPNYANSNGAVGYFYLDTTQYENGVHTIQWTATDNAGNTDGIGSRYFNIQNTDGASDYRSQSAAVLSEISEIPSDYSQPVRFRMGYSKHIKSHIMYPNDKGAINIELKELERLVLQLNGSNSEEDLESFSSLHLTPNTKHLTLKNASSRQYTGYLVVVNELRPLPIGSTFDRGRGVFYWQPGPGFLGEYSLVFICRAEDGTIYQKPVTIKIIPRF